jgi:hypothetical protein
MAATRATTPYAGALVTLAPLARPPEWLTAVMTPERLTASLRRHLPTQVAGRSLVEGARTERVRVRDGRWQVRCRATVSDPYGRLRQLTLAGTLTPPDGSQTAAAGVPDDHPGTARPRLVPGTRLRLADLGLDLTVQEPEAPDPELPVVADLLDPERAARLIETALAAERPGTELDVVEAWVLRQKLGSRCTVGYRVRYRTFAPGLPDRLVAKAYTDDTGARAHEAMTALDRPARAWPFLAEPLGYLPDRRVLLQGWVDGDRTLKELTHQSLVHTDPELAAAVRRALLRSARALAQLHRSGASYGAVKPFSEVLAKTRAEVLDAAASTPELAAGLGPVLDALAEADLRHPADDVVPSHGAFRPAQVLVAPDGVALVDLDGAGAAEPARDLGQFGGGLDSLGVADVETVGGDLPALLTDRLRLLDDYGELFLTGYGGLTGATRSRAHLWQALELVESVLHAWTHGRPERAAARTALLAHHLNRGLPGAVGSDRVVRERAVQVG